MPINKSLPIRRLVGLAALAAASLAAAAEGAPTPPESPGSPLPEFRFQGVVLDYSTLSYRPHNDILFPSVIKAAQYFDAPLAKYYM